MGAVTRCYIGLGSNLDDPFAQVTAACSQLQRLSISGEIRRSSLYRSAPMGPAGQADYCNAVAELESALAAVPLLAALRSLEDAAGRRRDGPRWGARTLDLDLLLYGQQRISEPQLQVPHPHMTERNFVMRPLAELAPSLPIPGKGRCAELADALGWQGLALWV